MLPVISGGQRLRIYSFTTDCVPRKKGLSLHIMANESVYLAPKPRYEILDGLRGVAALMVVAFHLLETYSKGPAEQIINHGYLAGSVTTDARSTAVCKWMGDISYPLYITHFPLMYMQMNWVAEHASAPLWQHIIVSSGVFFVAIILAWGLLKIYDTPVREWLRKALFAKKISHPFWE